MRVGPDGVNRSDTVSGHSHWDPGLSQVNDFVDFLDIAQRHTHEIHTAGERGSIRACPLPLQAVSSRRLATVCQNMDTSSEQVVDSDRHIRRLG